MSTVYLWTGRTVLLLCFLTIAGHLYPRAKAFLFPPRAEPGPEEDAHSRQRRETARLEQQAELNQKSSHYQENILKPREEGKQKKKTENHYRLTGQSWMLTEGQGLGEGEQYEQEEEEDENETAQQRAVRRRRLPAMDHRPEPVPQDPPLTKRVIVLPDEPSVDTEGVVNVALRCPSGRTVYRRFLQSHPSSTLVDWMFKSGYHPAIYEVFMAYPRRRPIPADPQQTLADVGIVRNTMLQVDERDPSTT
ncbi:UBX domain-containing protein 8 isoform X2 [Engraulis encrasicolus]